MEYLIILMIIEYNKGKSFSCDDQNDLDDCLERSVSFKMSLKSLRDADFINFENISDICRFSAGLAIICSFLIVSVVF